MNDTFPVRTCLPGIREVFEHLKTASQNRLRAFTNKAGEFMLKAVKEGVHEETEKPVLRIADHLLRPGRGHLGQSQPRAGGRFDTDPLSASLHAICPFGGVVSIYQIATAGTVYVQKTHAASFILMIIRVPSGGSSAFVLRLALPLGQHPGVVRQAGKEDPRPAV